MTLFGIIGLLLVLYGIWVLVHGAILWGIVLIVVGLALPGGIYLGGNRRL
jgi:hypothetical protein